MQSIQQPRALDFALLLGLGVLWASSFTVMKFLVLEISPLGVSMLRTGIAALLMMPFLWGRILPKTAKEWALLWGIGLLGNALPFTLIPLGETQVDSGLAGMLMALGPVFALLANHFFTKDDRITPRKFMGVCLGLSGVALLLGKSIVTGHIEQIPSILLIILATLSYVSSGILIRHMAHVDSVVMTCLSMAVATAFSAPLTFALGDVPNFAALSNDTIIAMLYLGGLPTACAFFLRFMLIKRAGYMFFSYVGYIIPALSLLMGWIFFAEVLGIEKILALVLILGGLTLFKRKE